MCDHDETYIIYAPTEPLHDVFVKAGVDSGDYRAITINKGKGVWSFAVLKNDGGDKVFAKPDFFFSTRDEAVEWLEPQVPFVD